MITFEKVTEETLYIAEEIMNSNKEFNKLETGRETRTREEIKKELMAVETDTYFIKLDDTYIGIIDYLKNNPKDGFPWLGLFMIHSDYQGYGFGTQAYLLFEELLKEKKVLSLRLGVLKQNDKGKRFWKNLGFQFYEEKPYKQNIVECMQKDLM
ncbi:GNAT family N-acetyltransferase [Peribacillus tepidiphilus]|jgi:ribosomal protein S18 acetylase RimI-like enzyme|uniref:GNAT family N-acetyltransferase n=1 Tax=Peribacillus tepidiphilus TaxID=2652445 RepID=UPI001292709C|nr:GNAT family N-acetyltransferase [Peribacillus tepidiphilus]